MTFLKKIYINNIRKLGEDIELPIQEGATIFLAPNGTGKTSIFEAIELGLTGGVKRLGDGGIGNLIRDQYSDSSVGLEFDNGIGGLVRLNKNESPRITGNIEEIFGTIKPENIPFLLRITHLLDQQSSDWFVHSTSDIAGSLLQNLSIARDASKANQVITGAKKAATSKISKMEEQRDIIKSRLENWRMLLNNRTVEKEKQSGKLKTLNVLADELRKIKSQIFKEDIQSLNIRIEDINIEFKQLEKRFRIFIENDKLKESELNQLMFSFLEFTSLTEKVEENENKIKIIESRLSEEKHRSNTIQNALIQKLRTITEVQEELDKIESEKKQYETLVSSRLEIRKNYDTFEELAVQISSHRQESEIFKKKIEVMQQVFDNQRSIDNRKNALEVERETVQRLEKLIAEGKRLERKLEKYTLELLKLRESEQQLNIHLNKRRIDYNEKKLKYEEFQQKFNNLNLASNAIQEAVSIIALNISEDENQCPVCLSAFNPNELNIKINEALNQISPAINLSKQELETAKIELEVLGRAINVKEADKNNFEAKISELEQKINNTKIDVELSIWPNFGEAKDLKTASEELSIKIENLNSSTSQLEKDASNLGNRVSEEEIRSLRVELYDINVIVLELESRNTSLVERNNVLLNIVQSIEELKLEFSHEKDEQRILISKNALETINSEINTLRNRKGEVDQEVEDLTIQFEEVKSRTNSYLKDLSVLHHKWQEAGFQGNLDFQMLEEEISAIKNKIKKNEIDFEKLQNIGVDLAGWAAQESYNRLEKEIKDISGNLSEEEFARSINEEYSKILAELTSAVEKNTILNTFSTNLSKEIDAVNDQILSINPFWKRLLNRTVVDPRFADTTLNSYSRYKKPLAEVQVQLHGNKVLASHVASEAQLTDLQLTFLLSMAYKYQWSDWKGLLLDDPTQHHDLVHAAGVFDLLRDYIYDHGFQILLTTHDPVHAKFFKRKLENDGIPVNLFNLKPTKNGVQAFLEGEAFNFNGR